MNRYMNWYIYVYKRTNWLMVVTLLCATEEYLEVLNYYLVETNFGLICFKRWKLRFLVIS